MNKHKCENCDYYNGLQKGCGCKHFHLFNGGCLNYIPRKKKENYTRCLKCKHCVETEIELKTYGEKARQVRYQCLLTGCAESIVPDNIKCPYYHKTEVEEQVKQEKVDNYYFESLTNETVNHPKHYNDHSSIECIDNMCLIFGATATYNYCLINAYKYMSRYKFKNGMEDLQKARWYLDHAISLQQGYNLIVNNEQFETLCSLCERYMIDYEEE